jgi:tetratricopeptide (TPR) repeat protein
VREAKAVQMLERARASEQAEKFLIAERHLQRLLERYPRTRAARDGETLLEELAPEIGTQRLFVQAEQAELAGDFPKAIRVYESVGEQYPESRLLEEARERLMFARRQQAAQESFEYALSVERQCDFAEAAKMYEAIVTEYPNTVAAGQAQERLALCQQAAPVFQEAYEAARRGLFDAALSRLDALLEAGLAYHGVYGGKGLVYELQRDWHRAAEMWELAQRASETEEGARHLRDCLSKAGAPVVLLGVESAQEVGSGMMVVSGRVMSNLAKPVKNVKIEIRIFAEAAPPPGARPLATQQYTVPGPVAPGRSLPFRIQLRAPSHANTLEPKVVGYEET